MNKESIRKFILDHTITRELFFIIGQRKVNLKKIDKAIEKNKISLSKTVEKDLVVSLTSYGQRLEELHYTLFSLVNQTIAPEKIIVNISYDDEKYITDKLKLFTNYGVEYNFCEDIRSFKKLIPTMQRFPKKTIVTVDDDMYYEKDWLESLWNKHLDCPNMIVAHNIYKINYSDSTLLPYDKWPHSIVTKDINYKNFFVGCGGVLYPSNALYKDFDNKTLYQNLTPFADDIWFYFMAYLQGTKITQPNKPHIKFHYVNPYREYGIIEGKTLTQENVGLGKNDEQFKNVLSYYNISEEDFIKSIEKEYEETND